MTDATFSIRVLTTKDAIQYRIFRLTALKRYPHLFRADADEEAQKPLASTERRLKESLNNRWTGAFDTSGNLIGCIGFRREAGMKRRHIGQVLGLQIAPAWQRRGIATTLVQDVINQASSSGIVQIQLSLTLPNEPAENLYDRLGFEVFGIERDALRVAGQAHDKQHRQLRLT
jgi:ribosomal protein S18 acetylase RimI-like enzyme